MFLHSQIGRRRDHRVMQNSERNPVIAAILRKLDISRVIRIVIVAAEKGQPSGSDSARKGNGGLESQTGIDCKSKAAVFGLSGVTERSAVAVGWIFDPRVIRRPRCPTRVGLPRRGCR